MYLGRLFCGYESVEGMTGALDVVGVFGDRKTDKSGIPSTVGTTGVFCDGLCCKGNSLASGKSVSSSIS